MLRIRAIFLALAATVAALCSPTLASAAPAMWRVRDADSEIYLFGTMHVLAPGLKWRTPLFDAAYAKADAVWFETDAQAPKALIDELMARYGVDADRRLVSVQHDVPPCEADPCPAYSSGAPARYVLELNAGQARKLGVSPGDELTIQR